MKSNGFITTFKNGQPPRITKKGQQFLAEAVTNPTGQVYAFTGKLPQSIVGAAMARLSRRPGDLRLALLEEFAAVGEDGAEALFDRVITGYGDDSVQQLAGIHIATESISNIMTKKLERRFNAPLEQSTRYIFFDQKDSHNRYFYYQPTGLPDDLAKVYVAKMDQIFDLYSEMVRQITAYLRTTKEQPSDVGKVAWNNATRAQACDAVRSVLPAATKSTVGFYMSMQALESLVMILLADDFHEARQLGLMILKESRQVAPSFLKRADLPERGGAITAYLHHTRKNVEAFVKRHLIEDSDRIGATESQAQGWSARLLDFWPKTESELLSRLCFEASHLPMSELERQVEHWDEQTQEEAFAVYFGERLNRRHRPKRAIEKAHFEWEILGDYGTFRDLHRHRVVDGQMWQDLTPFFGFEIPALVEEAGYKQQFNRCFELSSELYQLMVSAGYQTEAQYATLFGHRMRYTITTNLRELFHLLELRTGPDGHPGYRKICLEMHRLLAVVYPRAAKAMKFVNTREDPELTRLAAEAATQYKLEKLGANALESE